MAYKLTDDDRRGLLARSARCKVASRPDMDPNRIGQSWGKFWSGPSLRDWGYQLQQDQQGSHGNLPTLRAVSPDGRVWLYDGCMHLWARDASQDGRYANA